MPDFLGSAVVGNSGMAVIRISHQLPAVVWEISQISASVGPSSTAGNVGIFKNNQLIAPTANLTPIVTPANQNFIGQTASGDPYVYIQATDEVEIVISSVSSGDSVNIRAQYKEYHENDAAIEGIA